MNLLKKNKIRSIFILQASVLFSLLISCGDEKMDKKIEELKEKYHCDNFQDCLSKNEFDGAYDFYSLKKQEIEAMGSMTAGGANEKRKKEEELLKNYQQLISAQFSFWAKQKNFERAFNILQEYNFAAKYNLNTDDEDENVQYNSEVTFYNNLLDDLINKMIIESQPKEVLLLYCKSFKPIVKGDENNKGLLGGFNSYVLSNEPSKLALTKVNELEK
jgi:hypothetical protein